MSFLRTLLFFCHASLFAVSWAPPIDVYTTNSAQDATVGIDSQGNGVVGYTWSNGSGAGVGATQLIDFSPTNPVSFTVTSPYIGVSDVDISINGSGNGILIWDEYDSGSDSTARSAALLSNAWSSPIELTDPPLQQQTSTSLVTVASNNDAIALLNFQISSTTYVYSDAYVSGAWAGQNTVYSSSQYLQNTELSGNPAGDAFALWYESSFSILQGAYYNGSMWTVNNSITTDLEVTCVPPFTVSLNSSGTALIAWGNNSGPGISYQTYSGGTYGTVVAMYPVTGTQNIMAVQTALDDNGDGVLLWSVSDTLGETYLYVASFISGMWGSPLLVDEVMGENSIPQINIAVDGEGNAVMAWQRSLSTSQVVASSLEKGSSTPQTPQILSANTADAINPSLAVNSAGQAIVAWEDFNTGNIQATLGTPLAAPSNLSGKQVKNRFVTQYDVVNVLRWNASPSSSVASYYVFRNGVQIGAVPASAPLQFEDHHRTLNTSYQYSVTAVDQNDVQSPAAFVTVP